MKLRNVTGCKQITGVDYDSITIERGEHGEVKSITLHGGARVFKCDGIRYDALRPNVKFLAKFSDGLDCFAFDGSYETTDIPTDDDFKDEPVVFIKEKDLIQE